MAVRKGRAVSAIEKPVYAHLTDLFHRGTVHGFWAIERDDWRIQMTKGHPVAFDLTLNDVKDVLRRIDPEGCDWDRRLGKTGKPALLDLSKRLLAALTSGDHDERLIAEATTLIGAA